MDRTWGTLMGDLEMNDVIVDQELRDRLLGLDRQTSFRSETGETLGVFLPLAVFKKLLSTIQIPLSPEEIERRRNEPGGCSLQEFWQRMGRT
jgi:hypothetical protein